MNASTYSIGLGLALLGSNLCLLLLLLNILSWINFLHMDLTPIENFAESILLSPGGYQIHFQTAAVGWLIMIVIFNFNSNSKHHDSKKLATGTTNDEESKRNMKRSWHSIAFPVIAVVATLALPHILESHQHRHPIIRRSVIGVGQGMGSDKNNHASATMNEMHKETQAPSEQDANNDDEKTTTTVDIQQELVFSVDKMTCGGCGSHVRNLAEANLASQQKGLPEGGKTVFTINKVQVDWRAGVMSVYGMNVVDYVDRQAVAAVLNKDGHPTSFLYSQ